MSTLAPEAVAARACINQPDTQPVETLVSEVVRLVNQAALAELKLDSAVESVLAESINQPSYKHLQSGWRA